MRLNNGKPGCKHNTRLTLKAFREAADTNRLMASNGSARMFVKPWSRKIRIEKDGKTVFQDECLRDAVEHWNENYA